MASKLIFGYGLRGVSILCFCILYAAFPAFSAEDGYLVYGVFGADYLDRSSGTELTLFSDINVSGSVWDPRFMTFNTGVYYADFSGDTDWTSGSRIGYNLSTHFFSSRFFPFSLYYSGNSTERDSGSTTEFNAVGAEFHLLFRKYFPALDFNFRKSSTTVNDIDVREKDYYGAVARKTISNGNIRLEYMKEEDRYLDSGMELIRDEIHLDATKRFGKKHQIVLRGRNRVHQIFHGGLETPEVETNELYASGNHLFTKKINWFNNVSYMDRQYNEEDEDSSILFSSRLNIFTAHGLSYRLGAGTGSREFKRATDQTVSEDITSFYGGIAYSRAFGRNYLSVKGSLSSTETGSDVHDTVSETGADLYFSFLRNFSRKLKSELRYQYNSYENDIIEEDNGFLISDPARYNLLEGGLKRNYHSMNIITNFRYFKRYPIDVDIFVRNYDTEQMNYGDTEHSDYGIFTSFRNTIWNFRAGYTASSSKTGINEVDSTVMTFNGTIRPIKKLALSFLYRNAEHDYAYQAHLLNEEYYEAKASYYIGKVVCDFSYIRRNYSNSIDVSENTYYLKVRRNFNFRIFR